MEKASRSLVRRVDKMNFSLIARGRGGGNYKVKQLEEI